MSVYNVKKTKLHKTCYVETYTYFFVKNAIIKHSILQNLPIDHNKIYLKKNEFNPHKDILLTSHLMRFFHFQIVFLPAPGPLCGAQFELEYSKKSKISA